jgi:Rrf2 family nitric oxide-sensitive transcriptional repressor
MRLTKFSDYALRVLLLAAARGSTRITIEETAETYAISRAHLKKVVLHLTRAGYLEGVRGRTGGFTLGRPPEAINLGEVLRTTEPDFGLFECFLPENGCLLSRACRLPNVGNEALGAFLAVFDRYTLADILVEPRHFAAPDPTLPLPRRGPSIGRKG